MILTPITTLPANTNSNMAIRVNSRSVCLYAKAAELLDIQDGDQIVFLHDKTDRRSIYLSKSDNGYTVRKHGQSLMIYCRALTREIKKILDMDVNDTGIFRLGASEVYGGRTVVPVITQINLHNGT